MLHEEKKECCVCKQKFEKIKRCSACKMEGYCSEKCQKLDWKNHKIFCHLNRKDANYLDVYKKYHEEIDKEWDEEAIVSFGYSCASKLLRETRDQNYKINGYGTGQSTFSVWEFDQSMIAIQCTNKIKVPIKGWDLTKGELPSKLIIEDNFDYFKKLVMILESEIKKGMTIYQKFVDAIKDVIIPKTGLEHIGKKIEMEFVVEGEKFREIDFKKKILINGGGTMQQIAYDLGLYAEKYNKYNWQFVNRKTGMRFINPSFIVGKNPEYVRVYPVLKKN